MITSLSLLLLLTLRVSGKPEPLAFKKKIKNTLPQALELACKGELQKSYDLVTKSEDAGSVHTRSELDLILHANGDDAVLWHEVAKDIDRKLVPPLPQMYLDGKSCNGLADIFYVSAVTIKKLTDSQMSEKMLYTAYLTMITMLSDSGLHAQAEVHLAKALDLMPHDPSLHIRSALMTPAVFESFHHVASTRDVLQRRLDGLIAQEDFTLQGLDEFSLSPTFYLVYQGYRDVDFLTSLHNLYSRSFPSLSSYYLINPRYGEALADPPPRQEPGNTLRVGFVSSHFRRHSICKLFCGIISRLSSHHTPEGLGFDVVVFSGQDMTREDAYTARLKGSVSEFVRVNKFTIGSRKEVTTRHLDVLVYLDIGMDPSTSVWGASKLAPVQVCLWGHPSTTGMGSMDYFISADLFHTQVSSLLYSDASIRDGTCDTAKNTPGDVGGGDVCGEMNYNDTAWVADTTITFSEQLVRLPAPALGFTFARPILDLQPVPSSSKSDTYVITDQDYIHRPAAFTRRIADLLPALTGEALNASVGTLLDLVTLKNSGRKVVLIPQHLPKFHPSYDRVIAAVLRAVPEAVLVMTYDVKKTMWRRTLEKRWVTEGGMTSDMIQRQVLWMQNLKPNQYMGMLALGDVMLDPFPFGGGVTSLEALGMCTPVITLPARQTVPALTAGMISVMFGTDADEASKADYIHSNEHSYIDSAIKFLTNTTFALDARKTVCSRVDVLYDQGTAAQETVTEWANFLEIVRSNNFF